MDVRGVHTGEANAYKETDNSPSLSVRHHRRDGFTVSHNTRQSTSKLALDAQLGGRSSIYGATSSVVVDSGFHGGEEVLWLRSRLLATPGSRSISSQIF
ncbi:unnamed protein product [Pleuronectes platessa]|uniref:Uncharacterized protein n=1 Tax=Pleuronectes platessa TaxID=8262 RepID=A0A9N7Z4N4_PLEPL|nr:unnamed protein product [Pleuronectes platessa]